MPPRGPFDSLLALLEPLLELPVEETVTVSSSSSLLRMRCASADHRGWHAAEIRAAHAPMPT